MEIKFIMKPLYLKFNVCQWHVPFSLKLNEQHISRIKNARYYQLIINKKQHNHNIFNPSDEHLHLRDTVKKFVDAEVEPQAAEYNKEEKFNQKLFKKCGDLGLLGITADSKYGGSDMDATAAVIVHEELAASDPERFLPSVCDGGSIGGMCMSEPGAGTDVMGMSTSAFLNDSKTHYILNGNKMWITNGTIDGITTGDIFLVYAKTKSGRGNESVTSFIVCKDMPGFQLGQKIHDKCGMRASMTAELVFTDVKVPVENIVGEVGGATLCMMRNLEIERIALAAMSLGIARRSIEIMSKYANERETFGKKISSYGQIQKHIAESYAEYMAGRSYVYQVAANLDLSSYQNGLDADGVKLFCGPMAKRIADRAMQVLGGNGYISSYVVERLWRDSKLLEIGGGTNEAHHKNMVRDINKRGGIIQ